MDDDGQCELDVPLFIELKQSAYQNNDLGAFSTMPIGADQFIGNFKGKIKKSMSQCGDMAYTWAILSSRQVPLFYIDASDPKDSNWLRFIRTTSDVNKYNVICMQQNQQINYFTSKEIKLGQELITYLPAKKKKNRNKNFQNRTYKLVNSENIAKIEENSSSSSYSTSSESFKKENENKIQLELLDSNISSKYVLADFNLFIETKFGQLKSKRRLVKCNLCSFVCSVLITNDSSYLNELKSHYFTTHLTFEPSIDIKNEYKIDLNDVSAIVTDLMNSMLNQIEFMNKPSGLKCHICNDITNNNFQTEQSLRTHLTSEHSFKSNSSFVCLYCEKEFTKMSSFLNHLKTTHKEEIISNKLLSNSSTTTSQLACDFSSLIDFEENLKMDLEIDNEDENSVDSSSTVFSSLSSNKQEKNSKQNDDEKDEESTTSRSKSNKQNKSSKSNKIENSSSLSQAAAATVAVKTWTCQMCKKQFEQRIELSKHQCIELNLKLLKKKKDIRKKKWREAHWKRKIDLSYIETTSLTQLSQNIADNLSFCIDGTNEDLKAYSREVKDYINTEIRNESQMEMFLRCCFSDLQKKLGNSSTSSASNIIDQNLISKANSYFVESVYQPAKEIPHTKTTTTNHTSSSSSKTSLLANNSNNTITFNCKSCRAKCRSLPELIQHQRENHKLEFKTTFDCYNHEVDEQNQNNCLNWVSSNMYANSPIGYFACDPFSYVFNLHWDSTLQVNCRNCGRNFARNKYSNHALNCVEQMENSDGIEETRQNIMIDESKISLNQSSIIKNEDSLIIFDENHDQNEIDLTDNSLNLAIEQTCSEVMEHLLTVIESEHKNNNKNSNQLRISSRLHRSNQKKIDDKKYLKEKILENKSQKSELIVSTFKKETLPPVNTRKLHSCNKCGLEFTSANSVIRHQEKSCLRVEVITLKSTTSKSKDVLSKKKCPICGATFYNTHRVSIHIYKHHRNLLGSAKLPPTNEAKNLNSIQLKKLINKI